MVGRHNLAGKEILNSIFQIPMGKNGRDYSTAGIIYHIELNGNYSIS